MNQKQMNKLKKDALNDDLYETVIYLKEAFRNEQLVPVHKITAPDGHIELFRQSLSENCQHVVMWEHCDCKIERIIEKREVRGCNINGIGLQQTDPKILVYTTIGKANATEKYMIVKRALLERENPIHIEKHECHPYIPSREIDNCHNGTILDVHV